MAWGAGDFTTGRRGIRDRLVLANAQAPERQPEFDFGKELNNKVSYFDYITVYYGKKKDVF